MQKVFFKIDFKKAEKLNENKELEKVTDKFPENVEIAKEMLEMLDNKGVTIEEGHNTKTSLYIAITNKISIADMKNNYARIQTIAHECLHSCQDRTLLLFNFIFSNINMIYFSNSVLEWSEEKSAIIECFSQVAGDDKFYEFVEAVHKNKSSNYWNNNNNNVDFLYNLVSKYWWKKKVVQKCVESWKWLNNITNVKRWIEIKTDDEISWTPYFVIWNHLNNEVQPILWAYPIETFNEVINSMIVGNNKWL